MAASVFCAAERRHGIVAGVVAARCFFRRVRFLSACPPHCALHAGTDGCSTAHALLLFLAAAAQRGEAGTRRQCRACSLRTRNRTGMSRMWHVRHGQRRSAAHIRDIRLAALGALVPQLERPRRRPQRHRSAGGCGAWAVRRAAAVVEGVWAVGIGGIRLTPKLFSVR